MANEVKLYGAKGSPFVCRVKIALNMKGIKYENFEEDIFNKSADLLKYNPIHKKIPVLVHNENPISESLVIVEYIDEIWNKGVPILPRDSYERAVARFWAKFLDDKCIPALKLVGSNRDEKVVAEACAYLQILENELKLKGTKFFGGDNINLVDMAAVFIARWLGIREEVAGIKFFTEDKFPKLTKWAHDFVSCQFVKDTLPPREHTLAFYKKMFGKVNVI